MTTDAPKSKKKCFTAESANAALPLVRAIVADIASLSRDVIDRRQRLAELLAGRDLESGDPYDDELSDIEVALLRDEQQLVAFVRELTDLGVELRSAPDGLVDFPAEADGRQVFLCWQLDEPTVMFWHEVDGGFAGRRPLPVPSRNKEEALAVTGSTLA